MMKSFQQYLEQTGEVGTVEKTAKSVAWASGLPGAQPNELVLLETGQQGQVLLANQDQLEILLLSEKPVKNGTRVARTGQKLSIPVGPNLLGQVIDPLGRRLYPKGPFRRVSPKRSPELESPGVEKRRRIHQPLETGVALVDMLIPLGKGQRELIIGDRKTGKTTFLLQTVLNQARKGTICIWAIIGKTRQEARRLDQFFTKQRVSDKIILITASAQEGVGLIYLAPQMALNLAEYFRDQGQDTIVVLDDLSMHAKFYRELALSAQRFPGRDSYPVDIFWNHAALMEKGGNFKMNGKQVSLTILPVAETSQGNLSGYIQTNLMSMTDGHLFFDSNLFAQGYRPAINPFLSVTRVGRQTQTNLTRQFSRELMSFLAYHQKLTEYAHLGAELTDETKLALTKGKRLKYFFDQRSTDLLPTNLTVFCLGWLWGEDKSGTKSITFKKQLFAIISKYQQNKTFRKKVDKIIKESENLKELLRRYGE